MPKGPCSFRKSDIKRGVEALNSAGIKVARVEIEGPKITLIPDNGNAEDKTSQEIEL